MRHIPIVALTSVLAFAAGANAQCQTWHSGFTFPGTNGEIRSFVVYDDGTGPALYMGGDFNKVGSTAIRGVAKWNASTQKWEEVGGGVFLSTSTANTSSGKVRALQVWDPDGAGPLPAQLAVAGQFARVGTTTANNVALWNGTAWTRLGTASVNGVKNTLANGWTSYPVMSMVVYDSGDGLGEKLYLGGTFKDAGSITGVNGFASVRNNAGTWTWSGYGTGVNPPADASFLGGIYSMIVHNDGSGNKIFAGGHFTSVSGTAGPHIVRFNGAAFQSIGGLGSATTAGAVNTMCSFDFDGAGSDPARLVVGASASDARLMSWNGSAWSALDANFDVRALASIDLGSGTVLYASGGRPGIGNETFSHWNGSVFVPSAAPNIPTSYVRAMIAYDTDGAGPAGIKAILGGSTASSSTRLYKNLCAFDPAVNDCFPLPAGLGSTLEVAALAVLDPDGPGPVHPITFISSYNFSGVSQEFEGIGGVAGICPSIKLQSDSYTSSGGAAVNGFRAVDIDGSGPGPVQMYAFSPNGGITRWNGSGWDAAFVDPALPGLIASDLVAMDPDESGPLSTQVFVCGGIYAGEGMLATPYIGRWNGSAWEEIGSLFTNDACPSNSIFYSGFAVHNDGTGDALYIGGRMTTYNGTAVNNIARFNPGTSTWSPLAAGVVDAAGPCSGYVTKMVSFDPDGTGPQPATLVVTGTFNSSDTTAFTQPIAQWNGSAWSELSTGLATATLIQQFKVMNLDNTGTALYALGTFTDSSSPNSFRLAKYQSGTWTKFGADEGITGTLGPATTMDLAYEAGEKRLYVGGNFLSLGGVLSNNFGYLACDLPAPTFCIADHNHSSTVTVQDIFSFLSAWFSGNISADANSSGSVTVQDIFFFLSRWFAGC